MNRAEKKPTKIELSKLAKVTRKANELLARRETHCVRGVPDDRRFSSAKTKLASWDRARRLLQTQCSAAWRAPSWLFASAQGDLL